jgi:hypothetical protein
MLRTAWSCVNCENINENHENLQRGPRALRPRPGHELPGIWIAPKTYVDHIHWQKDTSVAPR